MKKMLLLTLFLMVLGTASMNAQVTIGNNEEPHSGAVLDLRSTGNGKGLKLPEVSLTDANVFQLSGDGSTATGMIVYNSNAAIQNGHGAGVYLWNGSKWIVMTQADEEPGGEQVGEIIIDGYKVYCYPDGVGCWMIQNSKLGDKATVPSTEHNYGERGYFYYPADASSACLSGFHLPDRAEWSKLIAYMNSNDATAEEKAGWFNRSDLAGYYHFTGYGGAAWIGWGEKGGWWADASHYYIIEDDKFNGPYTSSTTYPYVMSVRCVKD